MAAPKRTANKHIDTGERLMQDRDRDRDGDGDGDRDRDRKT